MNAPIFTISDFITTAQANPAAKVVYANGCSMTFGQEIAGFEDIFVSNDEPLLNTVGIEYHEERLSKCFAGKISEKIGDDRIFFNDALMGASNDRIFRTTIFSISKMLESGIEPHRIRVIIGFTSSARKEICENFLSKNTYQNVHANFAAHPGTISEKFQKLWISGMLSYIEMVDRFEVQLIALHGFLNANKIQHVFCDAISPIPINGKELESEIHSVEGKYEHPLQLLNLKKHVNPKNYFSSVFDLLDGDDKYSNWYISDFHAFCKRRNCPMGKHFHPLELGHKLWAEELENFLNSKNPTFLYEQP